MKMPPDSEDDWKIKREQIIGLGEHSARKSYYPELQQKLRELEHTKSILASTNKQLQSVLDAASEVSIIATDQHGMITIFNSGSEKMLGYSADEVVGKHTPLLFHSDPEVIIRGQELSKKLHKQLNGFDAIVESAKRFGSETREWQYICKLPQILPNRRIWKPSFCSRRKWNPSDSWLVGWPMTLIMY